MKKQTELSVVLIGLLSCSQQMNVPATFPSPSVFFPHLPLFKHNYKAPDGCNYASIRTTLANVLGHLCTRYYSSVKKCPFPSHFVSTQLILSQVHLKYVYLQKLSQTRKLFKAGALLLYLFIPHIIYRNFVSYLKICVLL